MVQGDAHLGELRLLLEELCCDLCRFEHVIKDQLAPETKTMIEVRKLAAVDIAFLGAPR
jgi:hypothetical protein